MTACFLSNISAKYYKNLLMLSRVIAKNVGDVFLRHSVVWQGASKKATTLQRTAVRTRWFRTLQSVCLSRQSCPWPWHFNTSTSKIPKVLICAYMVRLWRWPLISKWNNFIFVPNCTQIVNFVKFPQAVCKTSCSQNFSNHWPRHKNQIKLEFKSAFLNHWKTNKICEIKNWTMQR